MSHTKLSKNIQLPHYKHALRYVHKLLLLFFRITLHGYYITWLHFIGELKETLIML